MADKRFLTIHFTDGSKLSVTFPKQEQDAHQVAAKIQKAMDANSLTLEVAGELFMIPKDNIKYLQVSPTPEIMPDSVIRGAVLEPEY
jgi:hypothetical protein